MNKTIITMLAVATIVVQDCFAYDNLAEMEADLVREAQMKPLLKMSGAMLSSTTDDDDNTYWATGDLNVFNLYSSVDVA